MSKPNSTSKDRISENPFRLCDLKVYCDGIILVEEEEPNKKSNEFCKDQNIIWFEQYQRTKGTKITSP